MDDKLTFDEVDTIVGSGGDPWYLAERFCVSKRVIDYLQMGRIDSHDAVTMTKADLDRHVTQLMEQDNLTRLRRRLAARAALRGR